jgi:hypothetical protein
VALTVLISCLWPNGGYSQEKAPPLPAAAPTAPSPVSPDKGVPAWGPGLEWSPHKPGLEVESDRFASVDLALAFPHLGSVLVSSVRLGDSGPVLPAVLRGASLDPTVSPTFQFGALRFGPDYGALALSYSFLVSEGSDSVGGPNAGSVHSRLNLQTFDLDYLHDYGSVGWDTRLSWDVGARLQVVFFDTQVRTEAIAEQGRNYCFAAGPHAGLTLNHALPNGLDLLVRFDVGLLGAYNTDQNFVVTVRDPTSGVLSGAASQQQSQFAPSLAVQAGLSWTPAWRPSAHLRAGYQFEQWYNIGRVDQSRGDLYAHGLFLGAAWEF